MHGERRTGCARIPARRGPGLDDGRVRHAAKSHTHAVPPRGEPRQTVWPHPGDSTLDGGTRTAAISGAYVALVLAMDGLVAERVLEKNPLHGQVAAVSVGIYRGEPVLDLDYAEDSAAETDMNVVMNDAGAFIELQGTAEGHAFRRAELDILLNLAAAGVKKVMQAQMQGVEVWRARRS